MARKKARPKKRPSGKSARKPRPKAKPKKRPKPKAQAKSRRRKQPTTPATKKRATKPPVQPQKAAAKPVTKKPATNRRRKSRHCLEDGCQETPLTDHYCRLHYIKNWQEIIDGRRAKARANLNKYVDTLAEKYPTDYIERIRDDLSNEKNFHNRLQELGFRKELEGSATDNPFQIDNIDDLVQALKFDE